MKSEKMKQCIEACYRCAAACDECASACLREKEIASLSDCIRNDLNCADICRLTAAVMARGNGYEQEVCNVCSKVCAECAAECEKHSHMDHCRRCAEACKSCAQACREMAA